MVDEIELVRQFRSDVPEPSSQARAQAWAAVMAVAAEEGTLAPVALLRRQRRQSSRRVRQIVALAAAVAAVAAVLIVALSVGSRPSHVPGALITSWQASRPSSQPVGASGDHNSPGALRLVSYIDGPDWKQGSKQVPPGYLDCPAIDACYLLAQTVLTTVGPFPNYYNALYFSGDGGASWSSLALPPGLALTAPLSCPSALACVGVGDQGNKNELVSTTDGGHRWTVSPLRAPADVMSLSCWSVSSCSLVTDSSYLGPGTLSSSLRPPMGAPAGTPTTSPAACMSPRSRAQARETASPSPARSRPAPPRHQGSAPAPPSSPPTVGAPGRARHCRAARAAHWRPQSPATSAFWPAATQRTAFSLAAARLPIASWASRACRGTARPMVACSVRRRPGNLTSPPPPTEAGPGRRRRGPACTSVALPGTTPRSSPATRPGSPRPRLGLTSACTTSVARVQVTAGSPPRMARSRSYKRPTAVRIGPSNR